ncbi:hypothetical protein HOD83_00475 [Candidatus Woesearchaeota archaeon]|jgi:hypothetical protein|nr:hypothetical protein [Candidatus Woesearchaeota archaeon]
MVKYQREALYEASYAFIIFALAAVAWGVSNLVALGTVVAYWFAAMLVFLVSLTCITGLIHYWRYGIHK